MAALEGTKGGDCEDVNMAKRGSRSASERTVENFHFVACTEVKKEVEETPDKEVGASEEPPVPECEVCLKEEMCKVSTFEAISVPGHNVQFKQEADETEAVAAAPVLEQDPLQIEEEKVTTRNAADSERLMQKANPGCSIKPVSGIRKTAARSQLDIHSVTCSGSASRESRQRGRNQKPTSGVQNSKSSGSEPDKFTCNSCRKTFSSKYALLTHVFIHIDAVEPPQNICRLCADVFPTQRWLQMHYLQIHLQKQCIAARKEHGLPDTNKKATNHHKLQSIQCSADTKKRRQENMSPSLHGGSFQQAVKDFSRLKTSDCNSFQRTISKDATLPKRKYSETEKAPNAGHKKNTCVKLEQQAVDHPHQCNDCGRYFKYLVHLRQHAVSHQKKLLMCNYCDRTFSRPVDLRQHTLSHTGEKPHVCKCGKSFAKSGSLKRHEMVHRGERPFTCDVCFKSFTEAGVLRKHAAVHTGDRAYVCGECDKAFKEHGHLRRHLLQHTGEKPYKCSACGMSFTQSGSLTRHYRVHTGEKPYKCDVCSKTFADSSNFRVHMVAHHGKKSYKCDVCEKRFVRRRDLLQHVTLHIM